MTATAPDFETATGLRAAGEGFTAELDPRWSGPVDPHGGVLSALMLRAMITRVADTPFSPQSLHVRFLRAPTVSEVRIDAALERVGRRTASATAVLSQDGRQCIHAAATFAALEDRGGDDGGVAWNLPAPELTPAAQTPRGVVAEGWPEFLRRLDSRPALGQAAFTGSGEAVAGGWLQCDPPQPIDGPLVAFFADAWFPTPFVRLTRFALVPTIDLTVHFMRPLREPLAPEPVAVRFSSPVALGGTFVEDGELWTADGRLLARSRQSALLLTD